MFLRRLKSIAEAIGLACFALLAVYGAISVLGGSPAWAAGRAADVAPAPIEAPQKAPQSAPTMSGWGGATVPLVMNYQGNLTDMEGDPLSGYYTMTFRVYDDVIAPITSPLWSETHVSVTVRAGRFSVLLGNNTAISETLFNDPDRFIGVMVHPYDEMVPRRRFASVPYAVHANHAATATFAMNADLLDGQHADNLVPPGTVVAYAGPTTTVPSGWLLCDGSEVGRGQYPELFAAIETAHGYGDGVTTFNLPDYRGLFLRGVDAGAGRDPDVISRTAASLGGNVGDAVGSVQGDQIQTHTHVDSGHIHGYLRYSGATEKYNNGDHQTDHYAAIPGWVWQDTNLGYADLGVPVDMSENPTVNHGLETRPLNANVNWIIKY